MISSQVYKFFADYIYKNTGIFYSETDYYRLDARLNTLIKEYQCQDADHLLKLFQSNIAPDMHQLLINLSTNNESYFFRDIKPFTMLTKSLVADQCKNQKTIQIWSAGCSTGQEAYSMVMSILEAYPQFNIQNLSIDASDISSKVLAKAKAGIYDGLEVQRGLPITTLMKYFEQNADEHWAIAEKVKSRVRFFEFNLFSGIFPIQKYDVVFCRNVLIYQSPENKKKILNNIYSALKPGGYLLMGAGESLIGMNSELKQVSVEGGMVFQKPTSQFLKVA
jgi:chemotaxis protein methyltransferase CheR